MKIIKFRHYGNPQEQEIDVIPDSAIQKSGKPFFVPDFARSFHYRTAAAVHVCRLGKNIAERFANRYYEEAGVCLVIEAADLMERLCAEGKPRALATSFDASHITGELTPLAMASLGKSDITLTVDGKQTERTATPSAADFDKCIAEVSRYFTLKIGDLILIETGEWHDAAIDSRVTASIADFESINIKIK